MMLSIKSLLTRLAPRSNFRWTQQLSSRSMTLNSNVILSNSPKHELYKLQKCNIYSPSILLIERLDSMQHYKNQQFGPDKQRYIERVTKLVESGKMDMVLRDDLINLIGLAENETHIDLIEKIVEYRVKNQPDVEEKGWGTAIMRIYYKHGLTDRAFNNLKDTERFGNFFSQMSSYRIVLTMLYNSGRYAEVGELYERYCLDKPGINSENEQFFDNLKSRLRFVVFAAYAKLNTPEALKLAQALEMDHGSARCTMFIAYLALNQNEPKLALDYISRCEKGNHIAIRSLKINAYVKIKRFEDVLIMIHRSLDVGAKGKQILLSDTCDLIRQHEEEIDDKDIKKELITAIKELQDNGLVSDLSLDSFVFKELSVFKRLTDDQQGNERGHRRINNEERLY